MDIDFLYKIAAIGIIAAVVNLILEHMNKKEYTVFVTLTALVIGFMMLLPNISDLLTYVKSTFNL